MIREGHDHVEFFFGKEVEHTPAFNKNTMFIVGVQDITAIASNITRGYNIEHLYFGANQSFPDPDVNDYDTWKLWEDMVTTFLEKGYLCTLDIDVKCVEGLADTGLCSYNNFIPMISVKVPYINLLNYNATIKIDDKDFEATNPGVWCHSVHNLTNRDTFTDWSKYTKDQVL